MTSVISEEMCIALAKAGGIATIDQFREIADEHRLIQKVKKAKAPVAAACGVTKDYKERTKAIIQAGADVLMYDTPHAHSLLAKPIQKPSLAVGM
jgi:IMP dehydrogenase